MTASLLVLLATPAPALARSRRKTVEAAPAPPPVGLKSHGNVGGPMRFEHLGEDEGLPNLGVYAIVQDKTGFMWFGTQNGLARFDGEKMITYRHDVRREASIGANDISALAVDHDGLVWIGAGDKGLDRYDPFTDSFEHFRAPALPADSISALLVDSKGTLWAGAGGFLISLNATSGAVDKKLEIGTPTVILESPDGKLWVGTELELLEVDPATGESKTLYEEILPQEEPITALHLDGQQQLWVGTKETGVFVFKDGKKLARHRNNDQPWSLSDDRVSEIVAGPKDSVFIGTERGGLNEYRGDKKFYRYSYTRDAHGFSYSWVTSAYRSSDGVVWVGTLAGGINYFDESKQNFRYYPTNGSMTTVMEDRRDPNVVWMGSAEGGEEWGGLYRLDRASGEYEIYDPPIEKGPLYKQWVPALYQDKQGDLWIGTDTAGLLRRDAASGQFTQSTVAYVDPVEGRLGGVSSIREGKNGVLWLGTLRDGVARLNPETNKIAHYDTVVGLSSDTIYTVYPDPKTERWIWIGTTAGLNLLDLDSEKIKVLTHDAANVNSLPNDHVLCIHRDNKGHLWVGTYGGGLGRYDLDKNEWKRYDDTERHATTIYGILEDEQGRLWMSTNGSGILVLNPADESIIRYGGRDGLPGDEFAQGSYDLGRSGAMYFGGAHGMGVFDPRSVSPRKLMAPVVLTDFRIFDEQRRLKGGELDLGYRDSVVTFEYAALAYANPQGIRYEYMLDGLHDKWLSTYQNEVTFPNLGSGDYVFRVRAKGAPETAQLAIPMSVAAPPWRTWWAYLIYVSIVAGSVFAYVRLQRQRIVALENENRLVAVERDLALTAAVQTGFLPAKNQLDSEGIRLYGFYRAAEQCSGDWWWYERIGRKLWILVGDVTGHGPGPAMVTAAVGTAVRLQGDATHTGMIDRILNINREVLRIADGRYQMCLTVVEIDEDSGEFVVHSAGGLPVLVLSGSGQVQVVMARGTPLGSADFQMGSKQGKLEPGERLMALTDGLVEIQMLNGRFLGMRTVQKIYQESRNLQLDETAARLVQRGDDARGGKPQQDDWTFVIVEWTPEGVPQIRAKAS